MALSVPPQTFSLQPADAHQIADGALPSDFVGIVWESDESDCGLNGFVVSCRAVFQGPRDAVIAALSDFWDH